MGQRAVFVGSIDYSTFQSERTVEQAREAMAFNERAFRGLSLDFFTEESVRFPRGEAENPIARVASTVLVEFQYKIQFEGEVVDELWEMLRAFHWHTARFLDTSYDRPHYGNRSMYVYDARNKSFAWDAIKAAGEAVELNSIFLRC